MELVDLSRYSGWFVLHEPADALAWTNTGVLD
jgi:hypothetical protein